MKIKACPSIDSVRSIVQERLNTEREYLVGAQSAYDALNSGTSSLYKPNEETEKRSLLANIKTHKAYVALRETELALLQSHTAPRVLVEIEI